MQEEGNDKEKQANKNMRLKYIYIYIYKSKLFYLCRWHYSIICSSRQVHTEGWGVWGK